MGRLSGLSALVTSGPTYEPIDPVRFIGNRSSGKQGFAVAEALAAEGASVLVVSGPCSLPDPAGCRTIRIQSAREMLDACKAAIPADIAVCVAAVADYHVAEVSDVKIRKEDNEAPVLTLIENPDILKWIGQSSEPRPRIVVGFAGETERVLERAQQKRLRKGCDFIVGNDVSTGTEAFGGDYNQMFFVGENGVEDWPRLSKREIAERIVDRIATFVRTDVEA